MDADQVRLLLTNSTQSMFDDIRYSRVLGANTHIDMIGQMIDAIVQEETDRHRLLKRVLDLILYFQETRGSQSRAVFNALCEMSKGLTFDSATDISSIKALIKNNIDNYRHKQRICDEKITRYACNLCEGFKSILIYDYSSTVDKFIAQLDPAVEVYIPESRALTGGLPYVKGSLAAGHNTHFIPDTNILEALKECQAAFIGAESFFPDGTVFNTVGSDMLSLACNHLNVPLYALSPMVKLDIRNLEGISRLSPMPYDFSVKIAADWDIDLIKQLDFHSVKLVALTPSQVKGIVTEDGVVPPVSMFHVALNYSKIWRKDI